MSRRNAAKKREIPADRKYNSQVVAKFMNYVMKRGKKSLAEKIVYGALERVERQLNVPAIEVLNDALANISPAVELRSFRAGGVNYRIPIPIKGERSRFIALGWIISEASKRKGMASEEKLALELLDVHASRGGAFRKFEENTKMAESGRAFSHFRFFNTGAKKSSNSNTSGNR
ncbi:ribosomal protein S7 [Neorickettsia helminthoeca str. Oregon]|uniref:Small ribosomal subunit protein uS7 n=1 Tax=Neorickettsia helminthoeca str. Oregon TaxID=1286528 RepID=X5HMA7_9RICK|nr:30S ribosomal protein S7 [Neorickettsia helminthoeca]AHX11585.1 ribosomal protein S7 [Neorickettsia helminthoeca str. Oregon]